PSDVFGRLMVLRDDPAGTEVMAYVVWMFMLIGCWLAVQRSVASNRPLRLSDAWVVACPAAIALLGCLLFTGSNGEGLSWASVPQVFFIVPLFLPMLLVRRSGQPPASDDAKPWAYHRLVPVPLDLVFALAIYALSSDAWIATAATVLFVPMYRAEDALKAWPWAAGGVMLGLSLAWSQALSLGVAGFILVAFVLPWLLAPQEEEAASLSPWESKGQLRMALWGSVIIVSLYLVLTWVLLLTSIDAVNFEAHELYGAPFLAAVGAGLFVYTRRKDNAMATFRFLCGALALSVLGFLLAPDAFGRDATASVSEHLTRGHIVWMSLPMLLLAVAPVGREVVNHLRVAKAKGAWKRLPLGAHVVHFGLLLLLLGHLSTTVLVDRGDASHRISLVKDEIIVHEGLGLEFTGLELNDQNLEVGDGFIGVRIAVYEMDGNDVGALIGEVIPGTLRFDDQGVPRSEVATLTRLTGDVVFIFDGSQAGALMSSAGANGLDGIELVRVTVYNLPHSHLVWVGWCAMMAGMAYVALAGAGSSIKSSKEAPIRALEEE
ncbi:MAG TPA: hypothetical protein D7H91_06720, partial [Candidatus Poseidoniales archaeon]